MRIRINNQGGARGSVLIITLGVTLLLGLGLASYLLLVRWQHLLNVRSQAWNAAMGMAEAGIDDALAQLNPSALLFTTNINRGANGWTLMGDGMYHAPRRNLANGYYDVALSADTFPIICSTGYVTIPTLQTTIRRAVRVTTTTSFLYRGAMAARRNIDLKGNGITADSFDSMDPAFSTNGLYDQNKRKANGDLATTDGLLNVQNANIMGTLYTGPDGTYSMGAQGSVGDIAWVLGGNRGVQTGHYKNDFNMDFPDVLAPYTSAVPPDGDVIDGTNYTWILGYGNYMYNDPRGITFKTGDHILVVGRARMYVTSDFIMLGGSSIIITPGASLDLYVGGANAVINSVNNAGNCANFSYFGLPGNTSIQVGGNSLFLGGLYAPNANLVLNGGGNSVVDFQGSCVVNSVTMDGHFNFHFDENLKRKGPVRGYQVTSWTEL